MTKKNPSTSDELRLGHHLFYYTFGPVIVLTVAGMISGPILWWFGKLTWNQAMAYPWALLAVACFYLMLLGDYCMPGETYRNLRDGVYDDD
jgi:hypothetical protein